MSCHPNRDTVAKWLERTFLTAVYFRMPLQELCQWMQQLWFISHTGLRLNLLRIIFKYLFSDSRRSPADERFVRK